MKRIIGFSVATVVAAAVGSAISLGSVNGMIFTPFALIVVVPIALVFGLPAVAWLHLHKKSSLLSFGTASILIALAFAICDVAWRVVIGHGEEGYLVRLFALSLAAGAGASIAGAFAYWLIAGRANS